MAEEVLGSGISKDVQQQLLLREALIGEQYKSKEHLLFFNSNGAWVRLASSINIQDKEAAESFGVQKQITPNKTVTVYDFGNSSLAKNNVLFGGTYSQGSSPGSGGILSEKHLPLTRDDLQFVTPGDVKQSSYHNYDSLGFRPVPGITSATVQSKNTYGTLREAEVKITVWTVEDLDLVQTLYLRPGYSILMEWGHSLGLSKDGSINKDIRVNSDFFSRQVQSNIEKALVENRASSDYNYDAMYGYISNFSWSFRQDGGYDCSVKIISKGVILESLALGFDSTKRYSPINVSPENEETTKEERRSIFHLFRAILERTEPELYAVDAFDYPNRKLNKSSVDTDIPWIYRDLLKDDGQVFKESMNDFRAFPVKTKKSVNGTDGESKEVERQSFYITLSVLLDLYNNFISCTDTEQTENRGKKSDGYGYTQFYTGWQDPILDNTEEDRKTSVPYEKVSKFLTTDYHFSINPDICLIPNQVYDRDIRFLDKECKVVDPTTTTPNKYGTPVNGALFNLGSVQKSNLDLNIQEAFENKQNVRGEKDDILNILVSLDHVVNIQDSLLKENKDSDQNTTNNMTVFMQRLLADINDSLGGVNDLDVSYDEDENLFYIVDRRLTPKDISKLPKLTLSGVNSTITNLSISSKISSNISSQISIAAQAGNGGTKDNIGPLLQWNTGLIDRHLPIKETRNKAETESGTANGKPEKSRLEKWLEDYLEIWSAFKIKYRYQDLWFRRKKDSQFSIDYTTADNLSSIGSYHKEFSQKYVAEFYYKNNTGLPAPGTIPVELSFTTIGIGGLKIGQAFGFSRGILPQTYTDDYGFIVTGLSHSIESNKWTTDVKALLFCAKPPSEFILKAYKEELGLECPALAQEDIVEGPDPAVEINGIQKVGALTTDKTPVFQTYGIDLRNSTKNQVLQLVREGKLVEIGDANTDPTFASNMTSAKILDGKYYLQATAAKAFLKWKEEIFDRFNARIIITSAVRFGENTGAGPHGHAIAVDIGQLFDAVGGVTDPIRNLNARKRQPLYYKQVAEVGKKYGWYNPWRLSDQSGTDELWHFEYWGPA